MISPSTSASKKQENITPSNSLNQSLCKLQKGPKPLGKHRFYLEIKSHVNSAKIETKIKQLGGAIELFLIREVTHVIADTVEYPKRSVATPKCVSHESLNSNESSGQIYTSSGGKPKPKTRAGAMLESVRRQSVVVVLQSPLENAKKWGIPIWNVEKALNWLEKVAYSLKYSNVEKNKRSVRVASIKSPYIKFETFKRDSRPVFQTLSSWPQIKLERQGNGPAFSCARAPASEQQIMTRKSRARTTLESPLQPGYCELCRVEYSHMSQHLRSHAHSNFVRNDGNFMGLDNLIKGGGTNVDTFLHLNGSHIKLECPAADPNEYCPPLTRNRMPRLRAGSVCERVKGISPLSPTGSETGRRLRSGGAAVGNLRVEDSKDCKKENQNHDTWESGRPKRTCIKTKRASADERLVADNKSYYKVEVMSTKLRSSGLSLRDTSEIVRKTQTPLREGTQNETDEAGLVVKFKRIRRSELSALSNEAENFMFPKKEGEDSNDDDDDDDDDGCSTDAGPNTTASQNDERLSSDLNTTAVDSVEQNEGEEYLKSEIEIEEDVSLDSTSFGSDSGRPKRRRTQAEAFIRDNQKYYKFETPGSRLRYQGSLFMQNQTTDGKSNGDCVIKSEDNSDYKPLNLDQLEFSFERVPRSEPWYITFRRQDRGEEYYTCFSDSGYWKPFLLPYQMGPLPPLDPRMCRAAFDQAEGACSSATCSTPDCCHPATDEKDLGAPSDLTPTHSVVRKKRGRKSKLFHAQNAAVAAMKLSNKLQRKSPRQHASTLAILSLIHHRKRRETNRARMRKLDASSNKESTTTTTDTLPPIPEEPLNRNVEPEPDYESINKELDDMLNVTMENLDQLEISLDQDVDIRNNLDAIDMLHQYDNCEDVEEDTTDDLEEGTSPANSITSNSTVRLKARKRKNNRTGWPKRKRILFRPNKRNVKSEHDVDSNKLLDGIQTGDENSEDSCSLEIDNVCETVVSVNSEPSKCCSNGTTMKIQHRTSSSDCSVEEVRAANETTARSSVNVDLEKWENAEKALSAKVSNNVVNSHQTDLQYQPIVRVQKIDNSDMIIGVSNSNKRGRSISRSPPGRLRVKRPRRSHPASPRSPRNLRRPRGRWYRER